MPSPLDGKPPEAAVPGASTGATGSAGKRVSWVVAAVVVFFLILVMAGVGYWLESGNRDGRASTGSGNVAAPVPAPPASVPVLLSEGKTVYASSFEAGNFPRNGNDGKTDTRWTARNDSYPQWWVVDLGANHKLSQTVIAWYDNASRYYGYRIDLSQDNSNYTTVVNKPDNTAPGTTTDNLSGTARYVRIIVLSCHPSGKYAAFYEARVYGY